MSPKTTSKENIVGKAIAEALPDNGKPWYRQKHLLLLNMFLIVPLLSSAASGFDGSLMNGLQSMEEWRSQFNNPKGTMLGLVNAAQNIGALIGPFISGFISDRFGRKWAIFTGVFFIIVATIVQASGHSFGQLVASRIIVGAAGYIAVPPSPLLVAELAYPTHRGKLTCLFFSFYYLGAIIASWSCYGCTGRGDAWAWRIPVVLQSAIPILQVAFLYFVPESPRWLVSKGRVDEARDILIKYHAGGDIDSPLVDVEINEIAAALEMEKEAKQTTWKSLIATPGNRKRTYIAVTLGLASQWSGTGVVSYYFTLVLDTIGITSSSMQTLINGFLQIFNLVFATLSALLVDFFGRRLLFLWSGIGMLISYVIWTACSAVFDKTGSVAAGRAVVGFIFIFFFHYDIAYTPLLMGYPTEIFPYSLRSKGMTVALSMASSSLVIASFCNSIAMDNIGWRYYIVFCVILALIVVNTYFFFPETKGYSLEEVAILFDGEKAADPEADITDREIDDSEMSSTDKKPDFEHVEEVSSH
ncbi:hypothetical protein ACI3LY_004159 [Candidozyma auris]|uniref:Major facilitator superfamily (MFS) profile domain-containing protein n=1 Tax=Candidozyma auris TaxID=498019 RepID=A0A8F2W2L6_CANAR|nr:hypothetical protein QG37_06536 [[Candida] auris]PIS55842.1 hypothetical protein CJI97_001077 [[Candida] auris]QWW23785.1 hypothetical protein CA7LBN_002619 [[Candida] auris]